MNERKNERMKEILDNKIKKVSLAGCCFFCS